MILNNFRLRLCLGGGTDAKQSVTNTLGTVNKQQICARTGLQYVAKISQDHHRVPGFDRDQQFEEGGQALGIEIHNENFKLRTDFMPLHLALAKECGGIVVTHQALCEQAGLTRLDFGIKLPVLPIYPTCHRDVQHNKKIRVLMDYLAENLPTAV